MTVAVSSQGDKLFVNTNNTGSGNPVWVQLHEMKSIPELGDTPNRIDATSLESESKEYIGGLPDLGDIEFRFNFMPSGSANSNYDVLYGLSRNQSYQFKWVSPRLGIQMMWMADFCYRVGTGDVDAVRELILSLIPRTKPVESPVSGTFTVTYNITQNGGTGSAPTDATQYRNAQTVQIKAFSGSAPSGKTFVNWNTRADNGGVSYDPNDTFSIYENTTLYAIYSN